MEIVVSRDARERIIVLMRHGVAEERSDERPDETRALTAEGQKKMKENAKGLAHLLGGVDAIVSSRLLRAVQTALFVAKAVALKQNVVTDDALRPESTVAEVRALIERTGGKTVVLVGHEPLLSQTALELAGLRGTAELKKGGCYVFRLREASFELENMLTPRVLRHIST